jgi:hypothetical protein
MGSATRACDRQWDERHIKCKRPGARRLVGSFCGGRWIIGRESHGSLARTHRRLTGDLVIAVRLAGIDAAPLCTPLLLAVGPSAVRRGLAPGARPDSVGGPLVLGKRLLRIGSRTRHRPRRRWACAVKHDGGGGDNEASATSAGRRTAAAPKGGHGKNLHELAHPWCGELLLPRSGGSRRSLLWHRTGSFGRQMTYAREPQLHDRSAS